MDVVSGLLPKDLGLIVFWHADIVGYTWLKPLVIPAINRTLQRANRIIVSDRSVLKNSPFLTPFAEKCAVVPYGVDVNFWGRPNAAECRAAARLRQQYPRMILTIGRLVPYKGLDILLHAMRELKAELVVIGEGRLETELKRLANEPSGHRSRGIYRPTARQRDQGLSSCCACSCISLSHKRRSFRYSSVGSHGSRASDRQHCAADRSAAHRPPRKGGADYPTFGSGSARHRTSGGILDIPTLADRMSEAGRVRAQSQYSNECFLSRMKKIYEEVASEHPTRSHADGSSIE